jgi:putative SOS response-associated peptidase YedK
MCTNFVPAPKARFHPQLGWPEPDFDYPGEAYVTYRAPIRILAPDSGEPGFLEAQFGLVPFWSKDRKIARHTYNARSETVAEKPSYRTPWQQRRYALAPMLGFFEPDYATGKAVRWKIERHDGEPFTVAAIWDGWRSPAQGSVLLHSFSLLTLNADGHPLMGRFHAPGDEKRSLAVIPAELRNAWLRATPEQAAALIRPMEPAEFTAAPAPRPGRKGSESLF